MTIPGGLIGLVLALVIIGVALQMLKDKVKIEDSIMTLINLVIVISVVLFILAFFHVIPVPGLR